MTNPNPPMPEDFKDPLENFEPKTYADPLEQALAEETVAAIQSQPYASVSPDTTIREALEMLANLQIACLLIEDNERLVGVVTDRDVLDKVALEYDKVCDQPVSSIMTADPVVVYETDSSAAALTVMAVSGFRHVPVLDLHEKILGIVSPQRVTAFLESHFHAP